MLWKSKLSESSNYFSFIFICAVHATLLLHKKNEIGADC